MQDTAHRGISLDQLHELEDHVRTRIASGERWVGQRPNVTGRLVDFLISSPDQLNLYDMNEVCCTDGDFDVLNNAAMVCRM